MPGMRYAVNKNGFKQYTGNQGVSCRYEWLNNYFGQRSFKCRGVVVFKLGAYNFVFAAPIVLLFAAAAISFRIRGKTNAVISTPAVVK